ncbi:MAG: J domain-containing protein [Methylotenera sp.]|nr:J domain-containing protein [Oligoflexia bacterium]
MRRLPVLHQLLVIDQIPLFETALEQCRIARQRVEEVRQVLLLHETRDLPAYERWFHFTLGKQISAVRELTMAILGQEKMLEAERKRHWAGFFESDSVSHFQPEWTEESENEDDPDAYVRRQSRAQVDDDELLDDEDLGRGAEVDSDEADGDSDRDDGQAFEGSRYQEGDSYYDDEEDFHFSENRESAQRFEQSYFRGSTGRTSGGFRQGSRSSRDRGESASAEQSRREAGTGSRGASSRSQAASASILPESLRSRIRERYRTLVRKLHPDQNPNLTVGEKDLWNQVQRAYQTQDLEQLDLLIVLSDSFSGEASRSSSLHQLKRATEEIEALLVPLKKKLQLAKKNRAWGFCRLQGQVESEALETLRKGIEKEFNRELMRLREHQQHLESQMIRFSNRGRQTEREPSVQY